MFYYSWEHNMYDQITPSLNRLTQLSRAVYMAGCLCYYSKWSETISEVVHDSMNLFSHQIFLQILYCCLQCRCFVCKLHIYFRIEVTTLCVQNLPKQTGRQSYYVHVSNISIIYERMTLKNKKYSLLKNYLYYHFCYKWIYHLSTCYIV